MMTLFYIMQSLVLMVILTGFESAGVLINGVDKTED